MPFRHLLFNRRNGAPQRAPDAQPISLDSARYFSLDAEFPAYQWPENEYAPLPVPVGYNPAIMNNDAMIAKHHALPPTSDFSQSAGRSYTSLVEPSYRSSPYDLESRSLSYSDLMDTDTASVSRGSFQSSLSSTSHLDIMFDTDGSSLDSLSRKPSVTSTFAPDPSSQALCPLLTGQVGQCNPSICGPDAPCLQYVNANYPSSLDQCHPGPHLNSRSIIRQNSNLSHTTSYEGSQHAQRRQRSGTVSITSNPQNLSDAQQLTPTEEPKHDTKQLRCPTTDTADTTNKKGQGQATPNVRKSRARQAHSLVERKYRENLNAKIQELHLTLKRARFGRPRSISTMPSQNPHPYDEDEGEGAVDDMTDTEKSYKVKKSDVLVEAMDYVHATERELHRMQEEINQLKSHVRTMEGWMRPDGMNHRVLTSNMNQMPHR